MQFDQKTVNKILNINEAYKAPSKLLELMLDDEQRPKVFKKFLAVSTDVSFDWFHEYFEDEQAERKSKKQDFTPESIAVLLNRLTDIDNTAGTYFETAAGTGGILIKRWLNDQQNDPVGNPCKDRVNPISIFTYSPRNYWYHAEEMSDKTIPFLIFNMSIRGMNGVIVQCDALSRAAKNVYFIRNDSDDFLAFSEVHRMPHNQMVLDEFNLSTWKEEL